MTAATVTSMPISNAHKFLADRMTGTLGTMIAADRVRPRISGDLQRLDFLGPNTGFSSRQSALAAMRQAHRPSLLVRLSAEQWVPVATNRGYRVAGMTRVLPVKGVLANYTQITHAMTSRGVMLPVTQAADSVSALVPQGRKLSGKALFGITAAMATAGFLGLQLL